MHLVRYRDDSGVRVGLRHDDGSISRLPFGSVAELLRLRLDDLRAATEAPGPATRADVCVLPPVDGRMEVWASGVTYRRSREARMEESDTADVYWRVYEAARPE